MTFALVIDDNKQTANALVEMMKLLNVEARAALSPAAAMSILIADIPQVIFLDINMPGLDGFEVLGYLKREPRLARVPVIVITSDDQPETTRRALKGGAGAVLLKPIMAELLENALREAGLI
jgi:CheY-like chemotaxis protein